MNQKYLDKVLYLLIEITQLLNKYECTYDEVDKVLKLLNAQYKQQREELEYDTLEDYFAENKNREVGTVIVKQMNHCHPWM